MRPMEIKTPRLRLAPLRETDRAALLDMLKDERLSRTYMVPELPDPAAEDALFRRLKTLSETKDRFVYGIFEENRMIGMIHEVASEEGTELGYFIRPADRNRGYASEALAAAIETLFDLGVETVKAAAFTENAASLRVMEKCGLERTGETETVEYRGAKRVCVCCARRKEPSVPPS